MDISFGQPGQSGIRLLNRQACRDNLLCTCDRSCEHLSVFNDLPPATGDVVAQIAFGGCGLHDAARARMGGAPWPLIWLQGDGSTGEGMFGVQTLIAGDRPVTRIEHGGRIVGSRWSDADAEYCLLAGILPDDPAAGRAAQTGSCFERIESILATAGLDFSHVVRTWLYLDDLLSWYDDFNVARTAFFNSRGVFDGLVPASTGIGAGNPAGAALVAGALAVRPRHPGFAIREVESPLQCSATDYRSSFSRAVELEYPDRRLLMVSGTASIAPDGTSLHTDDVAQQIQCTLNVVDALLLSRGMDWQDVTRAIAYFHDIRAMPVFEACCLKRGLPALPLIQVQAAVCRTDLLFEIELDAVKPTTGTGPAA